MKFGNIIYNKRNRRVNLGDDMQLLAIENLYCMMGIDYKNVIRVELSDLYNWEGEEIIVPISFPFYSYNDKMQITCFSEKIYPVFLALSILTDILSNEDVEYLKRFSPIGCRDWHTLEIMKKYKIDAYLFGCITLTLPLKWKQNKDKKEIFCIDVSEELKNWMPQEYRENACFLTNAYNIEELNESPEEEERKIYNKIIKNARLVITSRMHIALPCIAAGIPVIFAVDSYSYRFIGIDRFIKIYSKDEYLLIDWNPSPITYEREKEEMIELAISRVNNLQDKYIKLIDKLKPKMVVDNFDKGIIESVYSTEKGLLNFFSYSDRFDFIIWSVTQTAELIYKLLEEKWKNAKMVAVVDKGKKVNFHGKISTFKEVILEYKNAVVLVCSDSAIAEADEYLKQNDVKLYFYCCRNGMPLK